ncbi:MAG: peptidase dimerization domain-containing protein [Thermomicrobiales bacterium]
MQADAISGLVDRYLDQDLLVHSMQRFVRVPTEVPSGYETLMEPDDPKLVHYVQEVIRPELADLGVDLLDAPLNNLIAASGSGETGKSLLIMNYTPTQHNNLMDDPFSGRVGSAAAYGRDEDAVFGQGVSQNKAHQAVMIAVLDLLAKAGVELRGRLYWAVNNEGRSSHGCSDAILDTLPCTPEFGIIQIGTGLTLSLGNRGRVDVVVHVRGKAAHSSEPENAWNAIEGASDVVQRLRTLDWTDEHEKLGGRHAVPYKVRYAPLAPHTLPSDAWVTIDRRLLPGDDPGDAIEEIRDAIGDLSPFQYSVEPDVMMLPAIVEPGLEWVGALGEAHRQERGSLPEQIWGHGSFDAGGPCARGVPTVMYGASGGDGLLGDDFVVIADAVTEARVLARLILEELT